jgi:hypothetical protein
MWCQKFSAFGLAVESDFPLPGVASCPSGNAEPEIRISMARPEDVIGRWSGASSLLWQTVLGDGVALRHELGVAGDHRIVYGGTSFHVYPSADRVMCSTADRADFAWQRQLLDTVLFSVSFARGFELLHASAIATPAGAVAFVGPTGAGKSSLLAELIRRGRRLLSDDVLAIDMKEKQIIAYPAPAVMNLPGGRLGPSELKATIVSEFSDENEFWVVVPTAVTECMPLARLFVLDPDARETGVSRLKDATFLDIAPFAISLPHDSARARRRFEVLSALAGNVAIDRLSRAAADLPHQLADHVEARLNDPSGVSEQ